MPERSPGGIERAEALVRRLLERLGATIDERLAQTSQGSLGIRRLSELTSLVDNAIESNLRESESGDLPTAPNHLKVLLTYEEHSQLPGDYTRALAEELKTVASEYIANHRYRTEGPVELEIGADLFAKTAMVRAAFVSSSAQPSGEPEPELRVLDLEMSEGRSARLLLRNKEPAYIGRAAGSAARLDHPSVSRLHCSLALREGEVVLSDLGSSNGTWVNGEIVNHGDVRVLRSGDTVLVGEVALRVVMRDT